MSRLTLIILGTLIIVLIFSRSNSNNEQPNQIKELKSPDLISANETNLPDSLTEIPPPVRQNFPEKLYKVTKVIDGDTIEIDTGAKVRYIGIDTPETSEKNDCFSKQATEKNQELVENKSVSLEKDVSETDRYNRLLRYVYVNETFVNDLLVREGYAHSATFPPDVKYQEMFRLSESEAREQSRGLWKECSNSCSIKGNINSRGEKIFHLPGGKFYDKTTIEEGRGERFFCSEEEASKSGWRKSKI